MNYVKIKAKSPSINLSLFVPEKETGKVLKAIQAKHLDESAMAGESSYKLFGGTWQWVDNNHLSVSMRRVRINDQKARQLKNILQQLAIIQ